MSDPPSCTICLITDRRRMGADDRTTFEQLILLITSAASAGVDLVQIRERDLEAKALVQLAAQSVEAVRGSRTRIVVNDRLDVAIAAGADGTHLRGDSFSGADARRIAPASHVIGRSVHSASEAAAVEGAGGLDYVMLGTVFPTASKPPDHKSLGAAELAAAASGVSLPVLAVGGISLERLPDVARTGAAGFAAIGFFLDAWRSGRGSDLARRVRAARLAFDRSQPHP